MTAGVEGSKRGVMYKEWGGTNWQKGQPFAQPHYYNMFRQTRTNPNTEYRYAKQPFPSSYSLMDYHYNTPYNFYRSDKNGKLLLNQMVEKLAGMVSEQQYLADVVELGSTVDVVVHKLGQCLKLIRKAKKIPRSVLNFRGQKAGGVVFKPKHIRGKGPRKNKKKPEKADLSRVPQEWLELWFGIMPTVGAVADLAKTFDVPFDWYWFRKTVMQTGATPLPIKNWHWSGGIVCRGALRMINPNVGIIDKMGLTNVVSTVWELAPWSWAVDYFANIGNMFSNCEGLFKNVEWHSTSTTYRCQFSGQRTGYKQLAYNYWVSNVERGNCFITSRFMDLPLVYQFVTNIDISLKRLSYLLSACALTLKGKLA